MEKTILYALILLLFSCSQEKEVVEDLPKKTIIAGKIKNYKAYPTSKVFFADVIDFRDRKTVFKDSITPDGSFKIELDLYIAQDVKMRPLLDRIILHPGDSLFVNLDFKNIADVQFSGNRAVTNKMLRKYLWGNTGMISYYNRSKPKPQNYKLFCDSVKTDAFNKQKEFIEKYNPPQEIIKWSNDFINFNYYESLLNYPLSYFKHDFEEFNTFLNTSSYFDFTKNIHHNLKELDKTIINTDIYDLVKRYNFYLGTTLTKDKDKKQYSLQELFQTILEDQSNSEFQQLLLGNFFYSNLSSNHIDVVDEFKYLLDENISIPFIKEPLLSFYITMKNHLENPQIASDAILNEMGVDGKNLLDSIIAENKGKVLFVDIWATWCGPCLRGMTKSKELMPRFKEKDVEFIYICVNSTKENWKATLSNYGIGGKHYFCTQEQSKDIRQALGVKGIPHYLLINKQGHIVEPKCYGLDKSLDKIDRLLE